MFNKLLDIIQKNTIEENLRNYKRELFLEGLENLNNWDPQKYENIKPHGEIQVIDFFSGCGGVSLGFAAISQDNPLFRVVGGLDINKDATLSYERNFSSKSYNQDIRELLNESQFNEFIDSLDEYDPNKKTILIGCAPCQGFSAHRKKNWTEEDERNDLVTVFAKIAMKIEPDCIVMENVPDLLSTKYWDYYDHARKIIETGGYTIKQSIYNSATFGVPQERFRSIVIAMKKNFLMPEPIFDSSEFFTVRDAIGRLPSVEAGEQHKEDKLHKSASHRKSTINVIKSVPLDGGNRPKGVGPKCLDKVKGYTDVYGRLRWDSPAITITHYSRNPASGRFIHPEQHRGLTAREAAQLQSFPKSFLFEGSFDSIFKQIGEAVPPRLSLAIAINVLVELFSKEPSELELNRNQSLIVTEPISTSYVSQIKKRGTSNEVC